jgi:antitoxin ParD1/3/4
MSISLPDALKDFVEQQVTVRGFPTSGQHMRELIRKDRDRLLLRNMVLDGAASPPANVADSVYFDALRSRVRDTGA